MSKIKGQPVFPISLDIGEEEFPPRMMLENSGRKRNGIFGDCWTIAEPTKNATAWNTDTHTQYISMEEHEQIIAELKKEVEDLKEKARKYDDLCR
jgi:hypothetical protein